MTWTFCTSAAVVQMAGVSANSTALASGGLMGDFCDQAEAEICTICRSDVVTNYGSLTANGKVIINKLCALMIAFDVVTYDLRGTFVDAREAETTLDKIYNQKNRILNKLEDDEYKTYLGIT